MEPRDGRVVVMTVLTLGLAAAGKNTEPQGLCSRDFSGLVNGLINFFIPDKRPFQFNNVTVVLLFFQHPLL